MWLLKFVLPEGYAAAHTKAVQYIWYNFNQQLNAGVKYFTINFDRGSNEIKTHIHFININYCCFPDSATKSNIGYRWGNILAGVRL